MRQRSKSPNTSAISDNAAPYKCKIIFQDQISNEFTVRSFIELLQKIPAQFNQIYGHHYNILFQEGDKINAIQTARDFKQSVNPQNFNSELTTEFYCQLDSNGHHFQINPETPKNPTFDKLQKKSEPPQDKLLQFSTMLKDDQGENGKSFDGELANDTAKDLNQPISLAPQYQKVDSQPTPLPWQEPNQVQKVEASPTPMPWLNKQQNLDQSQVDLPQPIQQRYMTFEVPSDNQKNLNLQMPHVKNFEPPQINPIFNDLPNQNQQQQFPQQPQFDPSNFNQHSLPQYQYPSINMQNQPEPSKRDPIKDAPPVFNQQYQQPPIINDKSEPVLESYPQNSAQPFAPSQNDRAQFFAPSKNDVAQHFAPSQNDVAQHFAPSQNDVAQHFAPSQNDRAQFFAPSKNDVAQHFAPSQNDVAQHFAPSQNDVAQHFAPSKNDPAQFFAPLQNDVAQPFAPSQNDVAQHFPPSKNDSAQHFAPSKNESAQPQQLSQNDNTQGSAPQQKELSQAFLSSQNNQAQVFAYPSAQQNQPHNFGAPQGLNQQNQNPPYQLQQPSNNSPPLFQQVPQSIYQQNQYPSMPAHLPGNNFMAPNSNQPIHQPYPLSQFNNPTRESQMNQQPFMYPQNQLPSQERESPAKTYLSQPPIKQQSIDSNKIPSSSSSQRKPSHAEEEDRRNQSVVSVSSLNRNELIEKENQIRQYQEENKKLLQRLQSMDMQLSQLKLEVSQKDQEILKLSSSQYQSQQRSTCYKCKGEPRKRQNCQTCEGSGYQSDSFNQELQHRIKEFIDLSLPQAIVAINKGLNQVSGMIESSKPVNFDKEIQQRRYLEQANQLLQSQPLGLPRVEQNRQALDLVMVSESFTDNFIVAAGSTVSKKWYLKNTGAQYIARNSCLQKVNEEKINVGNVPIGKDVPAGSYFESEVKFQAPSEPGHYRICLQMKIDPQQASQIQMLKPFFGEKVWCDFIVQDPYRDEGFKDWQDINNIVDKSKESKNGISSLIHIAQLPPYGQQPASVLAQLDHNQKWQPLPGFNNPMFPEQPIHNQWVQGHPVNIPPFASQSHLANQVGQHLINNMMGQPQFDPNASQPIFDKPNDLNISRNMSVKGKNQWSVQHEESNPCNESFQSSWSNPAAANMRNSQAKNNWNDSQYQNVSNPLFEQPQVNPIFEQQQHQGQPAYNPQNQQFYEQQQRQGKPIIQEHLQQAQNQFQFGMGMNQPNKQPEQIYPAQNPLSFAPKFQPEVEKQPQSFAPSRQPEVGNQPQSFAPSRQQEVGKQPQSFAPSKQPESNQNPYRGLSYNEALKRLRPEDQRHKDLLQALYEFQQIDFERNLKLAKQFVNDPDPINRVMDEILQEGNGDEDPQNGKPVINFENGGAQLGVQGGLDEIKLNESIQTLIDWQYGDYDFCRAACIKHGCDLEKIMGDVIER